MVKVRALRFDGEWLVSCIPFIEFIKGKFYIMISKSFRDGCGMKALYLIWPWQEKYLKKV